MTAHVVTLRNDEKYPHLFQPRCLCGWSSPGYGGHWPAPGLLDNTLRRDHPEAALTDDQTAHIEAIWRGEATGFSEQKLRRNLAEHEQMLADLNARRIRPEKVIGKGHKKPTALARDWLTRQIEQNRMDVATRGRTNSVNRHNADFHARQQAAAVA